ncbi:metal-dependent hydrolase family protein [Spelaeicoccus albus]|uniref:Imidazolonepropionase-like amidohydrolase n=1 Tax=Spelaeicoccus albus TaxID=1280376 RepID=A0A7Z0AAW3_9MICO|nr:amidohydrolase family protein [Spelaeicoccus albus]NYI66765.1 imidazolonepropionase-like amidohydrolase [Spelaeicoccus albus]
MTTARLPLTPSPGNTRMRLVGATLIDGNGGEPVRDCEIAIESGRITYAGPRRLADADADATTVDLAGKTILPGFIDSHVHLALNLEAKPAKVLAQHPSERILETAATIRKTLMAGITTARDLAGLDAGYRDAITAGTIVGPRMHLAIQALSPTGGHTDHHLPNGTYVGPPFGEVGPIIDSDDDVRRTVRLLVRSGADVIKVCTTGGVSSPSDTPHDLGVPEHHVRLIVEEMGRRQGQPVAAHAQGTAGIIEAIRGGVASVEHGYEIDDEGIELMLEHDTFLVPTLSSALRVPSPDDVPGYLYEKKVRWSAIARSHVAKALQAGVKVAMGTDSAVCPHGVNLKELGHLVELGLAPMDAIVAGTRNAAALMRLDEHIGTLEAGKLADIVITEIDPLTDITALADPATIGAILQGGRLVKDLEGWFPGRPVESGPGA